MSEGPPSCVTNPSQIPSNSAHAAESLSMEDESATDYANNASIAAMRETRPLHELMDLKADPGSFVSRRLEAQDFANYVTDTDTDAENSDLPPARRWVWYCKLRTCPKYYRAWTCKSNFLLHLYETSEHRNDEQSRTREGRREYTKLCREETAYDLSEPNKKPPQDGARESA